MTDVQRNSIQRPSTPPKTKTSNSHFLAAPQNIPIQNSNARANGNPALLSPVNQNGSFAFDRVIKSGQVQRRLKKKGAWRSSWKPAFLVLRPNLLSVYKDRDETELRASITLSDVTAVAPVKKSNHDHVFGVFSPAKNYHFAGLSAREASEWIAIIRVEAHADSMEDLQPPSASLKQGEPHAGYETTDLSADDDFDVPGSPEVPHWSVRGSKARGTSQSKTEPRTTSGMTGYSGNESFATSQSDFSDAAFSTSGPGSKGYLSSSIPNYATPLSPIPDNTTPVTRPTYPRGVSNLSDHNIGISPPSQTATPKAAPRSIPNAVQANATVDPSRVIRQGHLRLAKTISGVKQWKTVWVVLRTQSLSFYKSSSEAVPTVTTPITSIIEAAEIDRKKKQNCFQIIAEEKTWKLQTETEDELESWLGGLKSVLVKQEAERERERGSRHASISQQEQWQSPGQGQITDARVTQSPTREGDKTTMTSGITQGMRGVSLEQGPNGHGTSVGSRRGVSPEVSRA